MSKLTIEQKSKQEKELDRIQRDLKLLLDQVEFNVTSYKPEHVQMLRTAYRSLDQVILLTDLEVSELTNKRAETNVADYRQHQTMSANTTA